MRGDNYDGPARTVYEELGAEPPLASADYTSFVEQLRPLYLEEVVCPIHLAAGTLQAAADAAAAGDASEVMATHQAARAQLYDALWHAGLLTLDEELQEVVADAAVDASTEGNVTRVKAADRLRQRQWHAWRTQEEPP